MPYIYSDVDILLVENMPDAYKSEVIGQPICGSFAYSAQYSVQCACTSCVYSSVDTSQHRCGLEAYHSLYNHHVHMYEFEYVNWYAFCFKPMKSMDCCPHVYSQWVWIDGSK